MSTYQARRKAAALARRRRDARLIQVNTPPRDDARFELVAHFEDVLERMNAAPPRAWDDEPFAAFSAPAIARCINDAHGRRAPVRKRRSRLAKKLAARGGWLHVMS